MDINTINELLESDFGKEITDKGLSLKENDKKLDKRLKFISAFSVILLTVLGYFAFSTVWGSVIFFIIAYMSSFYLTYSSKKSSLLNYITYYRSFIPNLIGKSLGLEVKKSEIVLPSALLEHYYANRFEVKAGHSYGEKTVGLVKLFRDKDFLVEGIVCYGKTDENKESEFEVFIEDKKRFVFTTECNNYLAGRVEDKDDLTGDFILPQCEIIEKLINS